MTTPLVRNSIRPTKKLISAAFAIVILATGALTANAAPGDIFVSDANHGPGMIYKFAPNGTRTTFATGLNDPGGLAFDAAGNLFEADYTTGIIYEFAPNGSRSTFATGLNYPFALAFDVAGNLFDADYGSGTIYKFALDSTRSTFATALNGPVGLAFDTAGNLFEEDFGSANIYKFDPNGIRTSFATGLNGPEGVAFDTAGNLFEADYGSGNIYKFDSNGIRTTFASGLNGPDALAFDAAGFLFVGAYNDGTIYKFDTNGNSTIFASGLAQIGFVAVQPPPPPPPYTAQIQQPINSDGSSVFSVRRGVVPVKFTLTQNGVATCTLPSATVVLTRTAGGTIGAIDESVYIGPADTGSNFRIDSCQYVYNLSASTLGVGTYRVDIKINGTVVGNAIFQLK